MGGSWEGLIRSVRETLTGLSNLQKLDDESLLMLLCIAETTITSRPFTEVSDDIRDDSALTLNHLILQRTDATLPVGDFVCQDLYACRR
jgi:hypothetical protein